MSEHENYEFDSFYRKFTGQLKYGYHRTIKTEKDARQFQYLDERLKLAVKEQWDKGLRTPEEIALNVSSSFQEISFSGIDWALD